MSFIDIIQPSRCSLSRIATRTLIFLSRYGIVVANAQPASTRRSLARWQHRKPHAWPPSTPRCAFQRRTRCASTRRLRHAILTLSRRLRSRSQARTLAPRSPRPRRRRSTSCPARGAPPQPKPMAAPHVALDIPPRRTAIARGALPAPQRPLAARVLAKSSILSWPGSSKRWPSSRIE